MFNQNTTTLSRRITYHLSDKSSLKCHLPSEHTLLGFFYFIICGLLWFLEENSGLYTCFLIHGFEFRVYVLLDEMASKEREHSLPAKITYRYGMPFHGGCVRKWTQQTRPEFEIGPPVPLRQLSRKPEQPLVRTYIHRLKYHENLTL